MLTGLGRLEYRGYDSAGIAVVGANGTATCRKAAGKLATLRQRLESHPLEDATTGIGHTRWATHGGATDENAHPHLADGGRLALVHNGIIENFAAIKAQLRTSGYEFASETDSEVVAVLLGAEYHAHGNDLTRAMRATVQQLTGTFTLVAMHQEHPGTLVAARRDSPLVIGVGDGEMFVGSDVAAFVDYTREAISIGHDQIVTVTADGVEVTDFSGEPASGDAFTVTWDAKAAERGGWPSFMAKEISEEPEAIANTLRGRIKGATVTIPELRGLDDLLTTIERIVIVGCGSASYAGQVAYYALEQWARIPTSVELAHEFRYRDAVIGPETLVISISQSGETMDTLMATRYARERGAKTLSICNTQAATIPRESDAVVYTHAGPEVAVASTKALSAQIVALCLVALHLARLRKTLTSVEQEQYVLEMTDSATAVERVLADQSERVRALASELRGIDSALFLGRNVGFPVAMEGALKLKEISYVHAEGFAAGELKHGPLALIEPGRPVVVVVPPSTSLILHEKVVSTIREVRARGAHVIAVAEEGDKEVAQLAASVLFVPSSTPFSHALVSVALLHLFALEMAVARGLDVDQPRNLAKSVTVE